MKIRTLILLSMLSATLMMPNALSQPKQGEMPDANNLPKVPELTADQKKRLSPLTPEEVNQKRQEYAQSWSAVQALSTPPNLPHFPFPVGGAKFLRGQLYPRMVGGPMYTLNYACPAGAPEMVRWYSEALKRYGWETDKSRSTATSITARKGRDICTVDIYPMARKTYKTTLDVRYQEGKN